jgi:hypothetical protein
MPLKSVLAVFLALGSCTLGCAERVEERRPVYAVRGRVFWNGQPTPGALVTFHPREDTNPEAPRPMGLGDTNGWFTLGTYADDDGAPAGQYTVTVTWRTSPEGNDEGESRLPLRFARATTSGLHASIKPGNNRLSPFRLKN